jgi:hypothetical protein
MVMMVMAAGCHMSGHGVVVVAAGRLMMMVATRR